MEEGWQFFVPQRAPPATLLKPLSRSKRAAVAARRRPRYHCIPFDILFPTFSLALSSSYKATRARDFAFYFDRSILVLYCTCTYMRHVKIEELRDVGRVFYNCVCCINRSARVYRGELRVGEIDPI